MKDVLEFSHSTEKDPALSLLHFPKDEILSPELLKTPGVVGVPRVILEATSDHLSLLIADDALGNPEKHAENFVYFDADQIRKSEALRAASGKYVRPLLRADIHMISPTMLFESIFELHAAIRGLGVGGTVLTRIERACENLGFLYMVGYQNDEKTATWFLQRGRHLLEEIRRDQLSEFNILRDMENPADVFFTITFLHSEDIQKYIKPECIGMTSIQKIEYRKKTHILEQIFKNLSAYIDGIRLGTAQQHDAQTVIEVLEDLCEVIQVAVPQFSDEEFVDAATAIIEDLRRHSDEILAHASVRRLESDNV